MTRPGAARTYPHGVPSWIDTEQPDLDAAQAFYGGLLGWSFAVVTPPGAPSPYLIATLGGQDVAGLGPAAPGAPAAWSTYVAVDDADAAAAQVAASGGQVTAPPAQVGPAGRSARIADPAGAELRLWQAAARLGAQAVNAPGTWNFSDLHAAAPPLAFYAELFGWAYDHGEPASSIRVPGYGDHLQATADPGIRERQAAIGAPPGFADVIGSVVVDPMVEFPRWHVTFRVDDRDAAAELATTLGGTVVATHETDWTRVARVTDPAGAEFSLSQFTPPEG